MRIIGIHKKTKEKVWFDTSWPWGGTYGNNYVCKHGEEHEYATHLRDNRFKIDPTDYRWGVEGKIIVWAGKTPGHKFLPKGEVFNHGDNYLLTIDLAPDEHGQWDLEEMKLYEKALFKWDTGCNFVCEQHPNRPFPHEDCIGPGMPPRIYEALGEVEKERDFYKLMSEGLSEYEARGEVWPTK